MHALNEKAYQQTRKDTHQAMEGFIHNLNTMHSRGGNPVSYTHLISPGMIPGYGMGNALELHMQDKMGGDMNEFFTTTQQYLGCLLYTSRCV